MFKCYFLMIYDSEYYPTIRTYYSKHNGLFFFFCPTSDLKVYGTIHPELGRFRPSFWDLLQFMMSSL